MYNNPFHRNDWNGNNIRMKNSEKSNLCERTLWLFGKQFMQPDKWSISEVWLTVIH